MRVRVLCDLSDGYSRHIGDVIVDEGPCEKLIIRFFGLIPIDIYVPCFRTLEYGGKQGTRIFGKK